MYIEHNGYVIMQKEDMRFIDYDLETTEVIEEAKIYNERQEAEQDLIEFNKDFQNGFEIINYHKTIWLDKVDLDKQNKEEMPNE